MSERRALAGDFADIRTVKSRSVVQVVIELPIEEGESIVKLFGFPQPSKPVRVALARLSDAPQIEATAEPVDGREHGPWHTLTPTLQSVLRCKQSPFWTFLRERKGQRTIHDETAAATYVRRVCGVNSRSSLAGTAAHKWAELDTEFNAWKAVE